MAIELFNHNEGAYNSALKMLNTNGKAAIIHPTGTGKSFMGFKLCEDFPQKIFAGFLPRITYLKPGLKISKRLLPITVCCKAERGAI